MADRIRLRNPTRRNTQARVVELGEVTLYFSYETLIAFASPHGRARLANSWGPTTGRHFNELGCAGFPVLEPADFDAAADRGARVAASGFIVFRSALDKAAE